MSLTPPALLIVLGFPLLVMAGMLMMSGIERKLTDSRAALARSDEEPTVAGPAGGEREAAARPTARPAATG
ncbi:hypothetical protein MXD58_021770, partial [Frankia sp. AgKG'84/4]|nr:hypothetical protein [Frankia sp. AgKG'84/4]